MAVYLEEKVKENVPYHKITGKDYLAAWADEFRKMEELDHVPPEELGSVLRWSLDDSFWRINILSGATFREKFGRLSAERRERGQGARQTKASQTGKGSYTPSEKEKAIAEKVEKRRQELLKARGGALNMADKEALGVYAQSLWGAKP